MVRLVTPPLRGWLYLGCLLGWLSPAAQAETLREQLQALAKESGFRLEGVERLGPEQASKSHGELAERVATLLQNYNYLMVQGQGGRIERIAISSLKDPSAKPRYNAPVGTTRLGIHHQVEASLTGPNGETVPLTLIVDTGASTLVLPESMIEKLGFKHEELRSALSQTASDRIPVRIGVLKTVRVGPFEAADVQVSFFPDRRLEGAQLLGMSFLNRFKFSLDDERNELTLIAK